MAYTTPRSWVAGDVLTAAQLNVDVRDNVSFLANPPACRVYHNAAQSYANTATAVASAFNTERYDTDTMHDNVTNNSRITIKTAGLFLVEGTGAFAINATGGRFIGVKLNGTTFLAAAVHPGNASLGGHMTVSTIYKFAVNDYIELTFAQNSGGALNLDAAAAYSPEFAATWIGLG